MRITCTIQNKLPQKSLTPLFPAVQSFLPLQRKEVCCVTFPTIRNSIKISLQIRTALHLCCHDTLLLRSTVPGQVSGSSKGKEKLKVSTLRREGVA